MRVTARTYIYLPTLSHPDFDCAIVLAAGHLSLALLGHAAADLDQRGPGGGGGSGQRGGAGGADRGEGAGQGGLGWVASLWLPAPCAHSAWVPLPISCRRPLRRHTWQLIKWRPPHSSPPASRSHFGRGSPLPACELCSEQFPVRGWNNFHILHNHELHHMLAATSPRTLTISPCAALLRPRSCSPVR